MSLKIVAQEQLGQSALRITPVYLPVEAPYAGRARRLTALADGHPLAGYLHLLGELAAAQADAAARFDIPLPDLPDSYWDNCALHELPPLGTEAWSRDAVWREVLSHLVTTLRALPNLPEATLAALDSLAAADADTLEQQASRLLGFDWATLDAAEAPFVAAALQVYFRALAARIAPARLGQAGHAAHSCPVCGMPPAVSWLRPGAEGLRYLHCPLCDTDWHHVRAQCTQCDSSRDIGYWAHGDEKDAVRAESCGDCLAYLKHLDPSRDIQLEPLADDLATLELDMAMAEQGFERAGPNFWYLPGAA
ncbi:formate dehydrogenase accessory protein FdhE [Laribacter hongkongensis]|uniref:formate dehydrogenase accessory protein FdhE n=1 Tax=Laribacter hongkongensis TaxID=168471 RepID=UPI001EFE8079|nr:formate dehydrogenase accessory protein FdhE [Laribacter hongkongensis]MCG9077918.1 formate dehydrogenase accessory protein FdhE [Laribacter hongkongensis]